MGWKLTETLGCRVCSVANKPLAQRRRFAISLLVRPGVPPDHRDNNLSGTDTARPNADDDGCILTIVEHHRTCFIQHRLGRDGQFFPERAMDALIEAVGLRMIRMRAHIGRTDGVHELHPIVADELRAAIMHDLWFAGRRGRSAKVSNARCTARSTASVLAVSKSSQCTR